MFGIESLGAATIGVLTLYVAQYVVKRPTIGAPAIAVYMVASILFVPIWLPLSRRFGKKALWLASMLLTAVSFGAMIFLTEGTVTLLMVLAFAAGTAASCGAMMGPSIQADVIDWDEHATGERKEGAYFAAWNFVFKVATGLTQGLTGLRAHVLGLRAQRRADRSGEVHDPRALRPVPDGLLPDRLGCSSRASSSTRPATPRSAPTSTRGS